MTLRLLRPEDAPEPLRSKLRAAIKQPKRSRTELEQLQAKAEREKYQLAMLKQLEYLDLARHFVAEYRFDATRKWRLDLYAQVYQLAIELQGGVHLKGNRSHTGKFGYQRDREKINAAIEAGIRVLEYTPAQIADGSAAAQVQRIIRGTWP